MPERTGDGNDKDQHAQVGAALRLGTDALMGGDAPWYMSRGVPAIAGVAKEVADGYLRGHTPDKWDAAATALGALLMYHSADDRFAAIPTISPERVAIDLRWRF